MKKLFFTALLFGFCFMVFAQTDPKVGDELKIKSPTSQNYNYVDFPRLNILSKRGKVANYKSVYGDIVVIDDIMTKDDGSTYIMLKKKDGSKFFGYLNSVKANYAKAIETGEISKVK